MPVPTDWTEQLAEFVNNWRTQGALARVDAYLGDAPFERFVLIEQAKSWPEYLQWLGELNGQWCFRGQGESAWSLSTSLDRAVRVEFSGPNSSGYYHLDRDTEQSELFLRFQQQAHHHLSELPPVDDTASWLALMQHHGVPTRLLDWTSSPHVALYFAVADQPNEQQSALWGIDLGWLETRAREQLNDELNRRVVDDARTMSERVNRLLSQTDKPVIVKIDPLRQSRRMAAQQGLLLCKLIHQATFSQILTSMMMHPTLQECPVVRKLVIDDDLRIECSKRLREMNIHSASLFPGIDGFSKSLKLDLEIKVKELASARDYERSDGRVHFHHAT